VSSTASAATPTFTAAVVEPPHVPVLHSHTHPLPLYRDTNFTWAFVAEERAGATRLIIRARIAYTPVWPATIVKALLLVGFGIGDAIQAGGMLNGIRTRAERAASARTATQTAARSRSSATAT
jgi:hypothetical protein